MLTVLQQWPQWQLSNQPPQGAQALPGGLTNQCFLLDMPPQRYVLRLEAGNSEQLGIDRDVEYRIHQAAADAGLVPEVKFRSRDGRYWIRDYVQGWLLQPQQLDANVLEQMALLLHRVHQLKVEQLDDVDLIARGDLYWRRICRQRQPLPRLHALVAELRRQLQGWPSEQRCVCHMDPTLGNWLRVDDRWQLLDWEYAGWGHPDWDLAALVQDAGLDQQQQAQLLQAYGRQPDDVWFFALAQLQYIAALWYCAQGIWGQTQLEAYLLGVQALLD
ncbi:hypothetical protein CHH28_04920 [Bacterioplanes sanyensis]|uniref:Aminoglycoside phosphotransferase domain-containing protein n=1 Tax=Bacterioplanes sanyensis TaxID=1249553 RepID=A0A222FIL3_9GAMM|nr:phosphotransferase [Bacterioplanes sanyensis]ASP38063.1 hypothetical protein CHH28_04920 [Bacterioplanes sanyensis]